MSGDSVGGLELAVRAYYEDTDAGGVVYHAAYLRFFERARTEFMRKLGFCHKKLGEEWGAQFVVRALSAEYFRPARLDDMLRVDARFAGRGRTYADFAQTARLPDGKTAATARARVVCVSVNSWRPVALPPPLCGKIDSHAG